MTTRFPSWLSLVGPTVLVLLAACEDPPTPPPRWTSAADLTPISNAASAASDAQTIILGTGMVQRDGRDPETEFSVDDGETWQPAYIIPTHPGFTAPIAGTSWIFHKADWGSSRFSTPFRTMFTLPEGARSPSLRVAWHADDDVIIRLNDCLLTDENYEADANHFANPQPILVETIEGSCFQAGTNVLSVVLLDGGGVGGLNYQATITYNGAPFQTITLRSGVTPDDGRDEATEFSVDDGATWEPAYVIAPHPVWTAPIAGTSWIFHRPDWGSTHFSVPFRTTFVLPPGAASPSLQVVWHGDNDLALRLNGCELNDQVWNGEDHFFDAEPDVTVTADASCFRAGTNVLTLTLLDGGGAGGFTYSATVTYRADSPSQNRPPAAHAGPDQTLECASHAGTLVVLDGSRSSDPDGSLASYQWYSGAQVIATGARPTVTLGLGAHEIRLVVTDDDGAADDDFVAITVQDTRAPGVSLTASPTELWPPNHQYHAIDVLASATDVCDAALTITGSVVSSELDDDEGDDGDHPADIRVTRADGSVLVSSNAAAAVAFNPLAGDRLKVRAERAGNGSGRQYTIRLTITDRSGNSSTKTFSIAVPHDRRS